MAEPTPDFETILVTLADDHVLTVTLNRPERLNSFTPGTMDDFKRLWAWASATDDVHAVVLRASGDRAFSTGVDVQEDFPRPDNPFSEEDPGASLSPKLNRCWKPVVTAVHGMAAGGAFYWLNESDIVIASEDATFFDPHVTYGMTAALEPIGLARRIPLGEVLRIALLGNDERVSAQTAKDIGLVTEVVSREDLWQRAQDLAAKIAAKPPIAVQGTVRAIWESLDVGRTQALGAGMAYVHIGNPLSQHLVDRGSRPGRDYETR